MGSGDSLGAAFFDAWYADMTTSTAKDEIQQRHLGLPPHLLSTSLLGWDGIAEVVAALRLPRDAVLLDLACGRGGYGLEIAARVGAHLIGVDFSPEGLRQAREQAQALGREADFRVGDLSASGLDTGSVDGVVCIDALQFAMPQEAAYREMHRVLADGGRVVLTCWEPVTAGDEKLPEMLRQVDLGAGLAAAGFRDVEVREMSAWRNVERAMWEEGATLAPTGDPALLAFHNEAVWALEAFPLTRRVMACGTASGGR